MSTSGEEEEAAAAGTLALKGLEASELVWWSASSFSGVDLPNLVTEKGLGAEAVQTGFSPAPVPVVRQNGLVEWSEELAGDEEANGLLFSPPDPPDTAANLLG